MPLNKPKTDDGSPFSLVGFAAFFIVVALFSFVSTKAGTRAIGIMLLIGAVQQGLRGRIAYGWRGRPPSGHITGFPAVAINVLLGLFGIAVLLWPGVAASIFGWS
jgi:hypothetical protein